MVFELKNVAEGQYVATADAKVLYDGAELRTAISKLATKLNTKKVRALAVADRQVKVLLRMRQAAALRAQVGQAGAPTLVEISTQGSTVQVLLKNDVLLTASPDSATDIVAALRLWRKELYRKKNLPTVALAILTTSAASSGGSLGGSSGNGSSGGSSSGTGDSNFQE